MSAPISYFRPRLCTNFARMGLLDRDCAHWNRHQLACIYRRVLVGLTIEFIQSFAFHLQLHLRILLEHLRIALSEQLRDPLVRYPSGTEPGGIGRAKIVDAEVRYLGTPQGGMPGVFQSPLMSAWVSVVILTTLRKYSVAWASMVRCSDQVT